MFRFLILFYCTIIFSCNSKTENNNPVNFKLKLKTDTIIYSDTGGLEKKIIKAGLTDVQKLIPDILVELKYSTEDNFLHADVYGSLTHAYLQPDVAEKLKLAEKYLQEKDSSLTLLIYDAVRPVSVQQKMWDLLKMEDSLKTKYVSNPKEGSIHNYGAAVDLTIVNKNTLMALDMGTPFDYFGELAEPQLENRLLGEGKLSAQQINNRKLLREVMQKAGFRQLPTEWWHYNSCSREEAKAKYQVIE